MRVAVLVVLVALAGAASAQSAPKGFFDFIDALFDKVFLPAINESAKDLAGTAAQILAGISVLGIPGLGKRFDGEVLTLEAQKKGFFDFVDTLWDKVFAPALGSTLQDLSGTAAQILAGISVLGIPGLGRSVNDVATLESHKKGFFDFMSGVWNTVLAPALGSTIQDLSSTAAQILAGISVLGIPGLTGRSLEEMRGFTDFLNTLIDHVFLPAIGSTLQDLSGTAAQILAGISVLGIPGLGKRSAEQKGFFNFLDNLMTHVFLPAINESAKDLAGTAAQILAGISVLGIPGLGKRSAEQEKGFTDFLNTLIDHVFLPAIGSTLQDLSGTAAQILAGISVLGIPGLGKRSAEQEKGFTDFINTLWNGVLAPALGSTLQDLSGTAAQILAGISVLGIPGLG